MSCLEDDQRGNERSEERGQSVAVEALPRVTAPPLGLAPPDLLLYRQPSSAHSTGRHRQCSSLDTTARSSSPGSSSIVISLVVWPPSSWSGLPSCWRYFCWTFPDEERMKISLAAVDFIRALTNFWVVACHLNGLLSYMLFFSSQPNMRLMNEFLNAWWPNFATGFGYQVDIFFVLSGFLLTWNFRNNSKARGTDRSLWKDTILHFVRRVFRLWPITIGMIAISLVLGDYGLDTPAKVLALLTYPLSVHVPMALGVLWSNRADILCTTVLFVCLFLFERYQLWSYRNCLLATLVSFLPKLYRFLTYVPRISYMKLKNTGLDLMVPAYMVQERLDFHHDVLYPGRCPDLQQATNSPLKLYVMRSDYVVFHQRITPFFIGMVLGLLIFEETERRRKAQEAGTSVAAPRLSVLSRLLHFVYLVLSVFMASTPLLLSLFGERLSLEQLQEQSRRAKDPAYMTTELPFVPDLFVSVLNRPLYAAAWAYLLYRLLLPSDHPLSLAAPWLVRLMSWRGFHWLAVYSYGLYSAHMKVMMDLLWGLLPPAFFADWSLSSYFLVGLALVYSLSLALGALLVHFVERPLTDLLCQPLLRGLERLLYPSKDKQS